jgi:hypothetical protein
MCECEALASLICAYLGYLLLDPEDVKHQVCGTYGTSVKGQGSLDLTSDYGAQKGRLKA